MVCYACNEFERDLCEPFGFCRKCKQKVAEQQAEQRAFTNRIAAYWSQPLVSKKATLALIQERVSQA